MGITFPSSAAMSCPFCSWRRRPCFVPSPSPAKPTVLCMWPALWARALLTSSPRPGKKVKTELHSTRSYPGSKSVKSWYSDSKCGFKTMCCVWKGHYTLPISVFLWFSPSARRFQSYCLICQTLECTHASSPSPACALIRRFYVFTRHSLTGLSSYVYLPSIRTNMDFPPMFGSVPAF